MLLRRLISLANMDRLFSICKIITKWAGIYYFAVLFKIIGSNLLKPILTCIWQLLSVNFGLSCIYVLGTCSCRLAEGLDECHSSDSGWYSLPSSARRLQQTKVKGGGTSRRNATASRLDFPYNCTPFTCKYNKHFIGRIFTNKHTENLSLHSFYNQTLVVQKQGHL